MASSVDGSSLKDAEEESERSSFIVVSNTSKQLTPKLRAKMNEVETMEQRMDGTDECEQFSEEKEEEDDNNSDGNSCSVKSLSASHSFDDYSDRPPPYLEIEEIPSYRWLSPSFARSEPDEISPPKPATATSPYVASSSNTRKKNPSSFRWSRWFSPADRKEKNISRSWISLETLKGIYRFPFEEIRAATNDFDTINIIGKGQFKTTYKGFLPTHNQIAVQLLIPEYYRNWDDIRSMTYVSSRLRHRNITSFLGYCKHNKEFMLIYKYEQNGSLDHLLFREDKGEIDLLNWRLRYKICLEIANGLAYLHKERIIRGNIKPSNILLDADFVPKIADFSFKFDGYLAPEYMKIGQCTEKADVFGYGVVILEIVSGKRAYMYIRDIGISLRHPEIHLGSRLHKTLEEQGNLLEFVDPRLGSAYSEEEALTLLKLSALCTKMASKLRPSISTVVSVLEGKLKVEELLHEQREDDDELDDPLSSEKEIDNIEPLESIKNYCDGKSFLDELKNLAHNDTNDDDPLCNDTNDDDPHYLHIASGDIDALFSVIDAIQIPAEPDGEGETPSSVPTAEVVAAFHELKNLVLKNNLEEALNEATRSKILHFCEILDGFDLSESQSGLVHRVKGVLAPASEFSGIQEEHSLYKKTYESTKLKVEETKDKARKLHRQATTLRASKTSAECDINNITNRKAKLHEELAKLDEELSALKMRQVHDEKKLVEIHKVLDSDAREITQLSQSLATADKRMKHTKKYLEKAQEDWKQIQVGLR